MTRPLSLLAVTIAVFSLARCQPSSSVPPELAGAWDFEDAKPFFVPFESDVDHFPSLLVITPQETRVYRRLFEAKATLSVDHAILWMTWEAPGGTQKHRYELIEVREDHFVLKKGDREVRYRRLTDEEKDRSRTQLLTPSNA